MKILGIDVGGSGIKGALVNIKNGELVTERHRIPTPQPATPKAVAKTIRSIVEHFDYKGPIGVGLPAAIQQGTVMTAANIDKKWIGVKGNKLIREITGCPTSIVNDADAAGLAEAHLGAGRKRKGVVMLLTLGTGIGSALIVNGKLVPNTELGHLHFKGGIAEHYAADSIRKKEELNWQSWADRLNEYLHHVYRLFYPDLFILGGGVSKKFEKYSPFFTVPTEIVPAQLLNQAGIVGAAISASDLVAAKTA